MKYFVTTLCFLGGIVLSATASAKEFSYTYVDGGVYNVEPDNAEDDTTLKIRGSFDIIQNFNLTAAYYSSTHGFIDRDILSVGGFYHTTVQSNFDVYGGARFINDFGDLDEAGLGLEGGVRVRPVQQLEVGGGIRHEDVYTDTTTVAFGRGIYEFTSRFGAGAEIEMGDRDSLFLFGRLNF